MLLLIINGMEENDEGDLSNVIEVGAQAMSHRISDLKPACFIPSNTHEPHDSVTNSPSAYHTTNGVIANSEERRL